MSDLLRRGNIVIANLDQRETKTIVLGLAGLLSAIDSSPKNLQGILKDHKQFVISLKEKMIELLATFE